MLETGRVGFLFWIRHGNDSRRLRYQPSPHSHADLTSQKESRTCWILFAHVCVGTEQSDSIFF